MAIIPSYKMETSYPLEIKIGRRIVSAAEQRYEGILEQTTQIIEWEMDLRVRRDTFNCARYQIPMMVVEKYAVSKSVPSSLGGWEESCHCDLTPKNSAGAIEFPDCSG